ncbi:MAG TPA: CocE/NonD family hydrolase [Solimonas sp.]|nr:CocE/NonD family hydrolase [Solimonas sp.]
MKHLLLAIGLIAALPAHAQVGAYDRIDALVPMSDGVQLDASLYIPKAASGRLPLVVRHHGGGSNKDSPYDVTYALKLVETGRFAVLMYSVRGHGNSEGLFDFFGPRTTQDFSEMLDWVASTHGEQVDTENVGSSGYSQGGGESLLPAEQDARVKALAVGNTFADLNYALNPNDCFKFSFATGIFLGAYTSTASRVDVSLALRWGAQFDTDTEDIGTPVIPSTTEELALRSPQTYVDALVARKVPLFWTNSWEDQLFPADHPERMLATLEAAGVPVHYWFASGGHAAGANFPAEEAQREQAMLDWFEQYLLGIDHGFASGPKVDYWQRVTGNPRKPGEWEHHTAAAWPIPTAHNAALYPHADGTLALEPAAGETADLLNDLVSVNVANDALVHEVAGNVPGMGDVLDQVPESANPLDTIRYTSAVLGAPLNVVGAPVLTVTQESTHAVVQQLDAKVWDEDEGGSVQLIWRGAVSGPLGSEVSFALWPNAHRFEPGHRIILTISSLDFPTFKPDIEPWSSTISLADTRLDLPATPEETDARSGEGEAFGGALSGIGGLLTLLGLRCASGRRRGPRSH